MLDRMAEFHDRIIAVARCAEAHLTGPRRPIEELAVVRQQMARLITAYMLFVHREIIEPLITCGSAADASRARMVKAECLSLSDEFRAYTRQWAIEDVQARWSEYQPSALRFIGRIRTQIRNVTELAASQQMLQSARQQGRAA